MVNKKRDIFRVVGLLSIAGIITWSFFFREYSQHDTTIINGFPMQISDWKATEIPISNHDYDILETRNAFSRVYKSSKGDEVMLFVVYSQNNRKVSHPPEICYTGSGATIVGKSLFDIKDRGTSIFFNRVFVEFPEDKETLYYTFKVGDSFTPNYWKQQFLIAIKTLLNQPTSSALIRISIPVKDRDSAVIDAIAQDFTKAAIPFVQRFLK